MRVLVGLLSLASIGLGFCLAQEIAARKPSVYTDGLYGFSIRAPQFAATRDKTTVAPVMLLGPAVDGFSPNVSVMVQEGPMTREDYRTLSLGQFKQAKLELTSQKDLTVGGKDAWLIEYTGQQKGTDLSFMALAVFLGNRMFLVTCTDTKKDYPSIAAEFRACIDSFSLAP
ncbi:MAG: hypothetical protein U1E76_17860 [Planctomycetota bacterium]